MKDFKTKNGFFTGNVGIGTSSPSEKLHVAGDIIVQTSAGATGGVIHFGTESDRTKIVGRDSTALNAPNTIDFMNTSDTGSTVRMRIDSDGNVGIGTTSPERKLEISANNNGDTKSNYIRITDTDTTATLGAHNGGIEFYSKDSSGQPGLSAAIESIYAGSGGGGEISLSTSANSGADLVEAIRIDSAGNVGIGTANPVAKLQIAGDSTNLGGIILGHALGTGIDSFRFYIDSENRAHITRGTSERITILNTGNVGIGTTSPGAKLEVYGNSTGDLYPTVHNNSAGNAGWRLKNNQGDWVMIANAALRFYDVGQGLERMRIDSEGNVGIGITTPLAKLSVQNEIDTAYSNSVPNVANCVLGITNTPTAEAANNHASLQFNLYAGTHNHVGSISLVSESATLRRGALTFCTDNGASSRSEKMRITSAGYVGIGTTSPSDGLLHLKQSGNDAIRLQRTDAGANNGDIYLGHSGGGFSISTSGAVGVTSADLHIDSAGNVGIGTTNPTDLLHVEGDDATIKIRSTATYSSTAGPRVVFQGKNSAGTTKYFGGIKSYSSGTDKGELAFNVRKNNTDTDYEAMRITSAGNVHIGTQNEDLVGADSTDADKSGFSFRAENSSGDALNYLVLARESSNAAMFINKPDQTTSQTSHYIDFRNSGTTVGRLGYDGTDVSITQDSDERLKTNIKDSESGLNIINGLQVRSFDWVNDSRKSKKFGFIAQEMHEVFEDAVRVGGEDPQEDAWAISESKLIPVLTKAIQEQQTIIEDLKSQNESLIARIEALEG